MLACFSGTGNSQYVAQLLQEELCMVNQDDVLGVVFPVHAWGVPVGFQEWLEPIYNQKEWSYVFLVMTCGTEAGYCERTFPYPFDAAFSVIMPNTYVCLPGFNTDGRQLEQEKVNALGSRIREISSIVQNHERKIDVRRGFWPWLMTYKIRPFFSKHLAQARYLHLESEKCNGCGKCVKVCPMQNISLREGMPVHGSRCCLCLGCFHNCPQDALWAGPYGKGKAQKVLCRK